MSGIVNNDIAHARPQVAPPVSTSPDEEIYCPICNYNLTGILTGRCPECGSLFDRQALMANQQANRITLIPWDDPAETEFWPRFKKTLRICLFDSKRFAFAFSVQPQETRASSFLKIVVFVLSAVLFLSALVLWPIHLALSPTGEREFYFSDMLVFLLSIAIATPIAIGITTILAAGILAIFCPHFDSKRHFRPWWSIAAYASSHYLLIPLGLPISVIIVASCNGPVAAGLYCGLIIMWFACGLLNAFTLSAVVHHRGAKTSGRTFAMLVIAAVYSILPVVIQVALATGAAFVVTTRF